MLVIIRLESPLFHYIQPTNFRGTEWSVVSELQNDQGDGLRPLVFYRH